MGFLKCKSCDQWERQYRALQLEVTDLRSSRLMADAAWAEERQKLVDRILLIERPAAGAVLLTPSRPLRERHAGQPILNLPGIPQDLRPKKANN